MQATETLAEGLTREYKVIVPAGDIEADITTRLQEIGRTIRLPGFRPGKVPISLLKQRYGQSVLGEVLEQTVNTSSQKTIEENGLRPAMAPKIDIENFDQGNDLEYNMKVELIPDFQPVDFSTLKLERFAVEVDPKEIDDTIERIATQQSKTEPVAEARAAKTGDIAVIDFVGKVDGEAFPGGTANDYQLELGSSSFIPGFEDQIIGAEAGDHTQVTVTFPEEYGAEQLAGKEAVFEVDLKELRARAPVEIDEEFAKNMGLESLAQLRRQIGDSIAAEYATTARGRLKRHLFDELNKAHDFELPKGLVDNEFDTIWAQVNEQLEGPGGEEARGGKSDEELEAEYRTMAERRVRLGLLLAEVGQQNNISVSQEDLSRAMRAEAAHHPGEERKVFEFYQNNPDALARLQAPILEDKVVDYILELAEVDTRTVTAEEWLAVMAEEAETEPAASGKGKGKTKAKPKKAASGTKRGGKTATKSKAAPKKKATRKSET
jgi:trigger factor